MAIDDTSKFLDQIKEIRALDLKSSGNLTTNLSKLQREVLGDKINKLSKRFPYLEYPERKYLEALKRYYSKEDNSLIKLSEEQLKKLDTKIEDLNLSARTRNCLEFLKIEYFGEIIIYSGEDLLKVRNLGDKSLRELKRLVEGEGFRLGNNIDYMTPEERGEYNLTKNSKI